MKIHITKRGLAQQALQDAEEEAREYDSPTEVIDIAGPDQWIECPIEDIEEYIRSLKDGTNDEATELIEDALVTGNPSADAKIYGDFLAWLQAEGMLHDPDVKYWAITGRIPGNDEDTGGTYGPCTEAEAIAAFTSEQQEGKDLEHLRARYGYTIFITCKFSSTTRIE